jgi:GIY-YIG catalytic domain
MPKSVAVDVLSLQELAPALIEHFGEPRAFELGVPPGEPGIYVWSSEDAVLYVGSAASLARRLTDYRRWIDGYDPETDWEVSVVHMLKTHHARSQWLTTSNHDEALKLERRLIEWHRARVGIAPIVTGWEAKAGSGREEAERWARAIWLRSDFDS